MELAIHLSSGVEWTLMKNSSLKISVMVLGMLLVAGSGSPLLAREVPALSVDAQSKAGVPEGNLKEWKRNDSKIYPQVEHSGALYIPSQYKAGQPANAVIFLDGGGYWKKDGGARAAVVLDNLIAPGAIPVTVGIFLNPGMIPATLPGAPARSVRSYEYDSMGPEFSKFLVGEILPEIRKEVNLRTDPAGWAVCGVSSSAIAAFTLAWERPDLFGNVISHIGSYTNIRGGFAYPAMIRSSRESPKPIRVWMQEGESDLDNMHGHWPLANEDMAAALRWAGYEYHFELTGGGHSGAAGGALLPAALKWAFQPAAKPAPGESPKLASKPARHRDADPKPGVKEGTLHGMPVWKSSVFPNTERAWSVYVPAGYKNDRSAGLMVFQDGSGYQNRKGAWGVPVVLDNLIASGEMPMVVAVFINPGHDPAKPLRNGRGGSNRGFEYDSLGDRYARFLVEEIIPELEKQWPVSKDPEMRGICGASSGGICAFNVAWERPDQFSRVLSTIGSFVNLRGGNAVPYLIRKTERKPLRVFLSDTTGDLDNPFGHWPTANRQMNAALAYMGYDVRFDFVEGYGHNSDRGGEILPDALRWLWRREPLVSQPGKTKDDLGGDMSLNKLLIPGAGWEVASGGMGFADGLSGDEAGNLYVNDLKQAGYYKISSTGQKEKVSNTYGSGARLAPDGRVVFCQGHEKRLAAVDLKTGLVEVLAEAVEPNDLVVTAQGWVYFTSTGAGEVVGVEIKSKTKRTMASGIAAPNGIALSPDGGTLAVSEYRGNRVWAWRLNPDGSLDAGLPVMSLRRPIDPAGEFAMKLPPPYLAASAGDGMCSDKEGRWYVTSALGVQVFDVTGRECGLLTHPAPGKPLVSVALAGPDRAWLYVSAGDRIFRRKVNAGGW